VSRVLFVFHEARSAGSEPATRVHPEVTRIAGLLAELDA
jgi:hypothetical protein